MNGISFLKHIEIHTTLYCICLRRWYFWLETMVIIKIESHLCHPIIWPWFSFSLGWNRFFFWIFELNGKKTNPYSPFWKNPISLIHQFSIKQFKKTFFHPHENQAQMVGWNGWNSNHYHGFQPKKTIYVNMCNTVYYIVSLVLRQTMLSVHNILSAFELFRELAERLLTTRDGVID